MIASTSLKDRTSKDMVGAPLRELGGVGWLQAASRSEDELLMKRVYDWLVGDQFTVFRGFSASHILVLLGVGHLQDFLPNFSLL